jgi:WD40 repeat protein
MWTDSPVQKWDSQTNKLVTFTTLADYIAAHTTTTATGSSAAYTGWSGLYYSFNTGGTSTGGTVSLWRSSSYDSVTKVSTPPAVIGQAKYSIRTVHGQTVLVIEAPAPGNDDGSLVMFAVKEGSLYRGSVRSASATGSAPGMFNKTMINAILAAGKKPAVLD